MKIVSHLILEKDLVYSGSLPDSNQKEEINLRSKVALQRYENYFDAISQSHSIPVMDKEIENFLNKIEEDGIILDIGGCWGWHWRKIKIQRPDVKIVIVDFLRENFVHAHNILGSLVGDQIFLVHADATSLPFPEESISAVWTVQTFQHIQDFKIAVEEAFRVLKKYGIFKNYSLNITPFNRIVYKLLNKHYHIEGMHNNNFLLNRANDNQRKIILEVFGNSNLREGYSESFYHPDLKIKFSGVQNSFIGSVDYYFSKISFLSKLIARQKSFEAVKK
jgi:ubiquinone/menaquinone biosynthesis C-methylase UbiE